MRLPASDSAQSPLIAIVVVLGVFFALALGLIAWGATKPKPQPDPDRMTAAEARLDSLEKRLDTLSSTQGDMLTWQSIAGEWQDLIHARIIALEADQPMPPGAVAGSINLGAVAVGGPAGPTVPNLTGCPCMTAAPSTEGTTTIYCSVDGSCTTEPSRPLPHLKPSVKI